MRACLAAYSTKTRASITEWAEICCETETSQGFVIIIFGETFFSKKNSGLPRAFYESSVNTALSFDTLGIP